MAYRLQPRTPLDAEIRRIAREQIDKAIAGLADPAADRDEAIHDARKRCKKLRGLFGLAAAAQPALAARESRRYRDIARALSGTRDRAALLEALDGLERRFAGEAETASFAAVRRALEAKRDAATAALGDPAGAVAATLEALREGRTRLDGVLVEGGRKRRRAVLTEGLEANYARARRDLRAAVRGGGSEAFHDLRKRIKYLAMHLRLLDPVWREALAPLEATAAAAAEDLGRDHDYAVLRAEIDADPASFGARADRSAVLARLDRHGSELRARAVEAASRLLAERPGAFAARFAALIAIADAGPERPEPPEAERRHAG